MIWMRELICALMIRCWIERPHKFHKDPFVKQETPGGESRIRPDDYRFLLETLDQKRISTQEVEHKQTHRSSRGLCYGSRAKYSERQIAHRKSSGSVFRTGKESKK